MSVPKFQKILTGCILCGTAYTLVATGGINSVKGMFTLVGLLQSIVLIMCAVVLFKYGKICYLEHFAGSGEGAGNWGVIEVPVDIESSAVRYLYIPCSSWHLLLC